MLGVLTSVLVVSLFCCEAPLVEPTNGKVPKGTTEVSVVQRAYRALMRRSLVVSGWLWKEMISCAWCENLKLVPGNCILTVQGNLRMLWKQLRKSERREAVCAHPLHLHAVVHDCCLMPMPGQGGLRKGSFSARAVWCPSNKHVVPVILGISWQEKSMFELRHQLKTVFTCFQIYTILCYIILYYTMLHYIQFAM